MIVDAPVPQLELSVGALSREAEASPAFGLRIQMPVGQAARLTFGADLGSYAVSGAPVRTGFWALNGLWRVPGTPFELGAGYGLRHDRDVPQMIVRHIPELAAAGRWALQKDLTIGGLSDWRVEAFGASGLVLGGLGRDGSPIGSVRGELRVGREAGGMRVMVGVRMRSLRGIDTLVGPFLAIGLEDRAGREGEIP